VIRPDTLVRTMQCKSRDSPNILVRMFGKLEIQEMTTLAFAVVMQLMFMIVGQAALIQEQPVPDGENGKIHGVVVDSQGVGFPGVGVTITHQASRTEYSLRANSSGEYNFTKLPSGNYNVLLLAPLLTSERFKTLKLVSVEVVAGKTINLKSQMQVSDTWDYPPEVPVMFPPTRGDIRGVVLDDLGAVMTNVDVILLIEPASSLERKTRTDSQGEYRFIDLRPGKYQVRLNNKKFCAQTVSAKVVVGKITNLKSRLKTTQPPCG
jgi:hypothetical protein